MHYSDLIGCPAFLFAEANKVHSLETVFFGVFLIQIGIIL